MSNADFAGKIIGFVGAGNMAEAIFRGIVKAGLVEAGACCSFDPSEERRNVFAEVGAEIVTDNIELAKKSDIIILAVKPQVFDKVVSEFATQVKAGTLVVSIAMGVSCERIEKAFGESVRVVRVMPNTPMMVGAGTSGVAKGSTATAEDADLVVKMFGVCGTAMLVEEDMLHAVTALSGSGPAYFFRFVELLAEAGEKLGLSPETAAKLAEGTCFGSAKLLCESEDDAATLRRKVTSPGGTTEAALNSFEADNFGAIVMNALKAAEERSRR